MKEVSLEILIEDYLDLTEYVLDRIRGKVDKETEQLLEEIIKKLEKELTRITKKAGISASTC